MDSLRTLGVIALIALARGIGYILGTKATPEPEEQSLSVSLKGVVVEVLYAGGMMDPDRESEARRSVRIYENGRVRIMTRGGETTMDYIFSEEEIAELITIIDKTDFSTFFEESDAGYCPSAVDGVDVTYTFTTEKTSEEFSNCDYRFIGDENSELFQFLARASIFE